MKRAGNLFEKIYEFDNIHRAYLKARRCKRYRGEILRYTERLEENLINIQNHLIWQSYQPGEYRFFIVTEPKERQIQALPFNDRVVQHALNNVIEPVLERAFIYHSYACRKGKGAHIASEHLSRWLYDLHVQHGEAVYCLKADISKYFHSIDHDALKRIIRRKIKCKRTLWLIDKIIDHNGLGTHTGIPVGNLTSQVFANVYLHELDSYVKETLREHYYMRYMDDFVLLSHDKESLRRTLADIEGFLWETLKLRLNPKTYIFKVKQGVDFIGYRHWCTHKKVRKGSVKRIRKKIKRFIERYATGAIDFQTVNKSIQSWLGHIKHADTFNLRNKILSSIVLVRREN